MEERPLFRCQCRHTTWIGSLLLLLAVAAGNDGLESPESQGRAHECQQSLLQIKSDRSKDQPTSAKAAVARSCPLPEGGRWCEVRLKNLPVFSIATRRQNDVVSWKLCEQGFWEEDDMSQFGRPGHLLDIGANLGYFSFAFAQAGWKVTAFEPLHDNLKLLNASLCRNPELASRIKLNGFGLGKTSSDCVMVAPSKNMGDGFSLCDRGEQAGMVPVAPKVVLANRGDFKYVGNFQMRRLDEVLTEQQITSVDAVKIDVEGHELAVFEGAGEFLRKLHPRIIKSEAWGEMSGGASGQTYLNLLRQAGYGFFQDAGCTDQFDASTTLTKHGMVDMYFCSLLGSRP